MERLTREYLEDENSLVCEKIDELNIDETIKKDLKDVLRKFVRYEDLAEKGRLPELPCAIGDVVWKISPFMEIQCHKVKSISIEKSGIYLISNISNNCFCSIDAFGETVFLSKLDALNKRKEMEEEH